MILFFHFICLLARYIVKNITKSLIKDNYWDDEKSDVNSECQSQEYLSKKAGHVKYPVYEGGTLKFFPPVYVQRYETVAIILEDAARKWKIKKVVDFGCSELGFFLYLKNTEYVTEILEVDIDKEILERYSYKAAPLTADYLLGKSKKPLDVYILAGSIGDYDDHLIGCDALVAIELIEHLSEEVFEKMPYNVFYRIKPKIAIFTTPNSEFNTLLPNFTGFRHKDHKFEWTRKEFYNWTQKILKQYPEYSVKFYGIGVGPEGTENLGCCTQMAVFNRSDDSEFFLSARDESEAILNYELIKHYKYPFHIDSRTREEKILHEIQFQAAHFSSLDIYYSYEDNESEIPLSLLKKYVSDLCSDDEELINILRDNGIILRQKKNDWFLVYSEVESSPSDTTSRYGDWLNEDFSEPFYEKDDLLWDDEQPCSENIVQSYRSIKELESISSDKERFLEKIKQECMAMSKETIKSAPQSFNQLPKLVNSGSLSPSKLKNEDIKTLNSVKSRIPRIKNGRYEDSSGKNSKETLFPFMYKPFKEISKSCSLDSCLENINCEPFERESYYLNLIPGGSSSSNVGDLLSSERKHTKSCSGSSLFSSSLDRGGDSGYPFSFSPPEDNLTPEQVDELLTENEMMSRSTTSSSAIDIFDIVNQRPHHDIFMEDIPVENGDLANNNRDGEGNNVQGLIGQRLINVVALDRDPNDNLFFPELEEFPPWLLNLGELVLLPV